MDQLGKDLSQRTGQAVEMKRENSSDMKLDVMDLKPETRDSLRERARVVDLGCAPGGWCQVAVKRVNALGEKQGKAIGSVLGIDLQEVEPIAGAELHVLDFLEEGADEKVREWMGGRADVVMSDMAASSSGHKQTDHLRIIHLCEVAAYFAFDVLEKGGTFVAKVLAGGAEGDLQKAFETEVHQGRQCKAACVAIGQF
ncbi:Ribosomal RNA large subunit methyltransferase E [Nymphon striatum]|nr:Ribosomal RNA large subunit methyltransferase E [Nymphon striatum]